jgi:hypothetical protein
MNPFPNQRAAADEVLTAFTTTPHRYVLLRADVQSGKTGTYQYLIRAMFERGLIDRAYIICGSHEIELINQCRADIAEWHPERNGEVKVLFRQHFKQRMNTHRALIVVDETHLVCDKDQTLSKFLQAHPHHLTMIGTTPEMVKNSTYMLSVDATPFAEISAIKHKKSCDKPIVTLENADGYFGPQHYFDQGLIHPIFSFTDQKFDDLIAELPQKYILIRITERNKQVYQQLQEAVRRTKCGLVRFTSKEEKGNQQFVISQKDADAFHRNYPYSRPVLCLESSPPCTTIVIVDGRLRCGKRLSKEHIGAVWETSKGANTDTILQGLLGRMSGYDVPSVKPRIYLPEKCLVPNPGKIIEVCDLERAFIPDTIPRYASHIILSAVQTKALVDSVQVYPCAPIQFQLSEEDTQQLEGLSLKQIRTMCLNKFTNYDGLDSESIDMIDRVFTPQQKQEIAEKLPRYTEGIEQAHVRRFQGKSHPHYFKSMLEAVATNTTINEHIDEYPFITFCVTYPEYDHESAVPGRVFAVIYTASVGLHPAINLQSRIPKQDEKTHFTLPLRMQNSPAISVIGFTPSIIDSPAEFSRQFDELIMLSKISSLYFSREVISVDGSPMRILSTSYGMRYKKLEHILRQLETKHSVQITYEKYFDRNASQLYCGVNWIRWQ